MVETVLTNAEVEEIRELLLQQKHRIEAALAGMNSEEEGFRSMELNDEADFAAASRDYDNDYFISDQQRRELAMIDHALKKIENGTFTGHCEMCGEEVTMPRYRIKPHARYCIECPIRVGGRRLSHIFYRRNRVPWRYLFFGNISIFSKFLSAQLLSFCVTFDISTAYHRHREAIPFKKPHRIVGIHNDEKVFFRLPWCRRYVYELVTINRDESVLRDNFSRSFPQDTVHSDRNVAFIVEIDVKRGEAV